MNVGNVENSKPVFSKPLTQLLAQLGIDVPSVNVDITHLSLDSRDVHAGSLFIAVKGTTVDARCFVEQALASGAAAVFVHAEKTCVKHPVYEIENLQEKVGDIAAGFYAWPSKHLQVIGVTGTNGKTTSVQLLQQLFELLDDKAASIGTMGYGSDLANLEDVGLTTPDAINNQKILRKFVDEGIKLVSMEVSSHAIDQHRHRGIEFTGAVFTNLTRDHLDYHRTMDAYAQAKARLFADKQLNFAVINADDPCGIDVIKPRVPSNVPCYLYGMGKGDHWVKSSGSEYLISANILGFHRSGVTLELHSHWGIAEINPALLGEFNVYNLLAVITTACALGYPWEQVVSAAEKLRPIAGRMQIIDNGECDISVCIDYAHTPDALEKAILAARKHTDGKLCIVFGCGGDRDIGKRPEMGRVSELADRIIVTSDNPRTEEPQSIIDDIVGGIQSSYTAYANRAEAIELAITKAEPHELVLIAGKGHEDYQIIGHQKLPFSDYAVALAALQKRKEEIGGVQ